METLEFFDLVLAHQGLVCLLELVGDRRRQTFYGSHEEAARAAGALDARGGAVYHACATFRTDDNRKQENAAFMRSFWVDADVDPANPEKYPDLKAALIDLGRVAKALELPLPLIVKSGRGAHAYFPLTEDVAAADWVRAAALFKDVLEHLGFRQDRTRTADSSSVLRPVGTHWRKEGVRRVEGLSAGRPIDYGEFLSRLDVYANRNQLQRVRNVHPDASGVDDLSAGIEYPPCSADRILPHCATLAHVAAARGNVGEPLWRAMLGIVKFTVEGAQRAHEWSAGHPEYDEAATQDKLDRWTAAPTTCTHFRGTEGNKCEGCPQKVTSPIHLGYIEQTPPPIPADSTAPPPPLSTVPVPTWLDELNARYAWIEEVSGIYDLSFRRYVDPQRFRLQEDVRRLMVPAGTGTKTIGAGSAWLIDQRRRQHKRLVLRPGEPAITSDNCLNEWRGFSIAPAQGDVRPFMQLFRRMFPEAVAQLYVLRWLAHLIQHPGEKMLVALVIWSVEQGVGKNLLFECVSSIIGTHHAAVIGQRDLASQFNASWVRTTIFAIGNEISSSAKRQDADALKGLLTDSELWVEAKHQPAYRIPNRVNFVFLSNHADAVFVEDHDRRFFVHEIIAQRLPPPEVASFIQWRDNGGLAALHDFFLRIDVSKFNPKAPAPMTAAKEIMIADNRSDLENWLHGIVKGDVVRSLGRELVTAAELARRYANEHHRREPPSTKAVTMAAKKLGAYTKANQVRLPSGEKVRPLALVQTAAWAARADTEWAAEFSKTFRVTQ